MIWPQVPSGSVWKDGWGENTLFVITLLPVWVHLTVTVILHYFVAKSISNSYFCKKFRYSFSRFIVSLLFIFILWKLLSQIWQNEMVFTFNEKGGSSQEILYLTIPLGYSDEHDMSTKLLFIYIVLVICLVITKPKILFIYYIYIIHMYTIVQSLVAYWRNILQRKSKQHSYYFVIYKKKT